MFAELLLVHILWVVQELQGVLAWNPVGEVVLFGEEFFVQPQPGYKGLKEVDQEETH